MNYTAIDFETATSETNSACSVAVAVVRGDMVCETYYALLKPPQKKFSPYCVRINGITENMVRNAPTFGEIWPRLRQFLDGQLVVAHNASFDMRVLAALLKTYSLPLPDIKYACTVSLSRRVWPDLPSHRLDAIGEFLHLDFRHHNALEDALVCAHIPLAAQRASGENDFIELAKKLAVKIRPFPPADRPPKDVREKMRRYRYGQRKAQKLENGTEK